MTTDGGLRKIFQKHLTDAHWQSVETISTGQGVPDSEYCFKGGFGGWIENKKTSAIMLDHKLSPEQIAWLERRARYGGRVFIAVRRQNSARGISADELFIFRGMSARLVNASGIALGSPHLLLRSDGGPARWDWAGVKKVLTHAVSTGN